MLVTICLPLTWFDDKTFPPPLPCTATVPPPLAALPPLAAAPPPSAVAPPPLTAGPQPLVAAPPLATPLVAAPPLAVPPVAAPPLVLGPFLAAPKVASPLVLGPLLAILSLSLSRSSVKSMCIGPVFFIGAVRQIPAIQSERRVLDAGPPMDNPMGSMRSLVKALSDTPHVGGNTMPASNLGGGDTLPSSAAPVSDNPLRSSANPRGGLCSLSSRRCRMWISLPVDALLVDALVLVDAFFCTF
jgi:hypothetical protein